MHANTYTRYDPCDATAKRRPKSKKKRHYDALSSPMAGAAVQTVGTLMTLALESSDAAVSVAL